MIKHKKTILKGMLIGILIIISIISALLLINANYFEINRKNKKELEQLSIEDLITLDVEVMDGNNENLFCLLTFISNDINNKIKRIEYLNDDNFVINTLDNYGKEKIAVDYKYPLGSTEEKVFRITTTNGEEVDKTISNLKVPKVEFGEVDWENGKATVEINKTGEHANLSKFWIEYQIKLATDNSNDYPKENNWIREPTQEVSKIISNLNHNDIIYARLSNGIISGQYVVLTIADTIPPEEFDIEVTDITFSGLRIIGNTVDNQSGLKDYTYIVEKIEEGGNTVGKKSTNAKITKTSNKKQQSININSVDSNYNYNANPSRSNNFAIIRGEWNNSKNK